MAVAGVHMCWSIYTNQQICLWSAVTRQSITNASWGRPWHSILHLRPCNLRQGLQVMPCFFHMASCTQLPTRQIWWGRRVSRTRAVTGMADSIVCSWHILDLSTLPFAVRADYCVKIPSDLQNELKCGRPLAVPTPKASMYYYVAFAVESRAPAMWHISITENVVLASHRFLRLLTIAQMLWLVWVCRWLATSEVSLSFYRLMFFQRSMITAFGDNSWL